MKKILNSFKENYINNQHLYYILAFFIAIGGINWLGALLGGLLEILGIAIYTDLSIRSEFRSILSIVFCIFLLLLVSILPKSKINIFLGIITGLLLSVNTNIIMNKTIIEDKVSLISPFIEKDELKEIYRKYLLIEGKDDYYDLTDHIDSMMADTFKN